MHNSHHVCHLGHVPMISSLKADCHLTSPTSNSASDPYPRPPEDMANALGVALLDLCRLSSYTGDLHMSSSLTSKEIYQTALLKCTLLSSDLAHRTTCIISTRFLLIPNLETLLWSSHHFISPTHNEFNSTTFTPLHCSVCNPMPYLVISSFSSPSPRIRT